MTWVVGANVEFGSVLLASDIRITLPNGREVDCLQKIHPLGYNLIGGFAGSVTIGMDVLAMLTAQFATGSRGAAWEMEAIVLMWLPRVIRYRFSLHQELHRKLGASFLIGSVSPSRNVKQLFPETSLYAFRSSTGFKPEKVAAGGAASIGNGTALEEPIIDAVRTREFQLTWNAGPQMQSFILGDQLHQRVLARPVAGVSSRFMMGWVVRGNQGINPWATRGAAQGREQEPSEKLKVVRSLKELDALLGAGSAEAVG